MTAHNLKGELGYLGISEASRKAGELEMIGRRRELQGAAKVFVAFETEISAILNVMRDASGIHLETQLGLAKARVEPYQHAREMESQLAGEGL
jgi:hypothetical protein